ncbi:DNA primase [Isoptericola sp. CG 20/1183]|uniref:DNA primase n=1 Tax=Isoptericola halotolerans TaxID=300560 RepID=A0ABX5EBS8_9MICO|nr:MULTISPECIES: DNA primase [Isoptericola]PRZ05034.1 DNA primase [Isoptericola halotolerans]PRZ05773.1 DNA primase [Isoptericola sp. CG 20/1183]
MAGLIKREDVEAVRERARIEEIVSAHVTLKSAGVGSMKGLCPFHDERTPSFHVRPGVGRWHCFGCGEGGDVISFVQKIDGMGFTDAVEHLADRVGVQLRYEDSRTGGAAQRGPREEPGRRQRLIEAHRVAAEFYADQLFAPGAQAARAFLAERSFGRADAETFGLGFAPTGWDALMRHLQGRGFTQPELIASGLVSQGQRGVYDRFRGRLVWPIRDVTGAVIGFGARKLFDEDQGPKYLNTPETSLYKKAHVLYGIDLAKRAIAQSKRVVIVEGYTDVMAAHLSGVEVAVATCGTAFGGDHAKVVRRLLGDTTAGGGLQLASGASLGGEIIFTFDGDAAGQKAAMRAFGEDQRFHAQTFVAVEPSGMDPCDLRMARGPEAVKSLVDGRVPLFEFVIRTTLDGYDLETVEGRVGALRAAAPLVAGIRDRSMQLGYSRSLARWIGLDPDEVRREVASASGRPGPARRRDERDVRGSRDGGPASGTAPGPAAPLVTAPDPRDPVARIERLALVVALQYPQHVPGTFDGLDEDAFATPAWRAVHAAIRAAGGVGTGRGLGGSRWVETVVEEAGDAVGPLVTELSVAPVPEDRENVIAAYVADVVRKVIDLGLTRRIADAKSRVQRLDPAADADAYRSAFERLVAIEKERRELRDSA